MKFFKTLHRAERRSFGLALAFYIVAAFGPIVAAPVSNALPDRFLFHVFLGVAVLFLTDALFRWQTRTRADWQEPSHVFTFLFTSLGGAAGLAAVYMVPSLFTGALIVVSVTFGAGVLIPGLRPRPLGPEGDERYRQSQLRAREVGLRALVVLGALLILTDLSDLVTLPLWLGVGILLWGVGSAVTGMMWWLERDGGAT
jgi:hypothetical protein